MISVGSDVDITLNPALENCSGLNALLDDVDDGAPGPGPGTAGIPDVGGDVTLSGNLTGCNSVDEVNGILFSDGFEEYLVNYTTWRPSLSEGAEGEPLASCNLWEPGDVYPTIDEESGDEINDLCGSGDLGDTCGPFNNPGWEDCVYTAIPFT